MGAPDPSTFPRPKWATYIEDRIPKFKQHSSLGLAKTAISSRHHRRGTSRHTVDEDGRRHYQQSVEGGFIYEFINDNWVLVATVEENSFSQDHELWWPKMKVRKNYTINELP